MPDWHQWCSEAIDRELQEKLSSLQAWCASIIAAFLLAAAAGLLFFVRWVRLSSGVKARIWPHFGWYSALLLVGSLFGSLSYACYFMSLSNFYRMGYWPGTRQSQPFSDTQLADITERTAYHDYWWAGIVIPHALEQCCMTFADLLILEWLASKIVKAQSENVQNRTKRFSVATAVIFLLLNLANIGLMMGCGIYNIFAGHEYLRSSAAYRSGSNVSGVEFNILANRYNDLSNNIQGIGSSVEAVIMVGIVLVFVVVGAYVLRVLDRVQDLLRSVTSRVRDSYNLGVAKSAIGAGVDMQKRVERTIIVVFITFLLRATYASMFATAFTLYDMSTSCSECGECQTIYTVMAPVALLLSLFGIILTNQDADVLWPRRANKKEVTIFSLAKESSSQSML